MNKYLPLITFTFDHDYYTNKKCKDIDLLLYEGEKEATGNYKLMLRKEQPGKFILYIDSSDNFNERLKFLMNDLADGFKKLSFILKSSSPYFTTFTKGVDIKSNNQLLKIQIPVQVDNSFPQFYEATQLERSEGNTAFEKQILKYFPGALIYMTLNTGNADVDALLNQIKNQKPVSVTIHFETKSSVWKYIFISRTDQAPDLSVIDTNQLVNFSEIEWTEIINNKTAGISYSDKEIDLSEKYPYHFQLWKNYFNGKSLIVDQLPFPDPSHNGNFYEDGKTNYISIYQYF